MKKKRLSHAENAEARREDFQASYPESSSQTVEGSEMVMNNKEASWGPAVTFRDSSPAEVLGERPQKGTKETKGKGQTTDCPNNADGEPETLDCLQNQFALLQPDWLQLSPYGDFSHARGLQRVDRAAAETLVAQFNSFRGRLGRLFGGIPFYIGHPDVPSASELADRKAYGWVNELEAREDGLYGLVKWSDAGLDLLRNAHFKYLSPYWEAREVGNENGRRVYQPVALVSVGLTNQPNIPVRPLANSSPEGPQPKVQQEETERTEDFEQKAMKETKGEEPLTTNGHESTRMDATAEEPLSSDVAIRHSDFPRMHTEALTNNLGTRRGELVLMQNRRDQIQEAVLAKQRLGMSYDEAWESVKRAHPMWFEW